MKTFIVKKISSLGISLSSIKTHEADHIMQPRVESGAPPSRAPLPCDAPQRGEAGQGGMTDACTELPRPHAANDWVNASSGMKRDFGGSFCLPLQKETRLADANDVGSQRGIGQPAGARLSAQDAIGLASMIHQAHRLEDEAKCDVLMRAIQKFGDCCHSSSEASYLLDELHEAINTIGDEHRRLGTLLQLGAQFADPCFDPLVDIVGMERFVDGFRGGLDALVARVGQSRLAMGLTTPETEAVDVAAVHRSCDRLSLFSGLLVWEEHEDVPQRGPRFESFSRTLLALPKQKERAWVFARLIDNLPRLPAVSRAVVVGNLCNGLTSCTTPNDRLAVLERLSDLAAALPAPQRQSALVHLVAQIQALPAAQRSQAFDTLFAHIRALGPQVNDAFLCQMVGALVHLDTGYFRNNRWRAIAKLLVGLPSQTIGAPGIALIDAVGLLAGQNTRRDQLGQLNAVIINMEAESYSAAIDHLILAARKIPEGDHRTDTIKQIDLLMRYDVGPALARHLQLLSGLARHCTAADDLPRLLNTVLENSRRLPPDARSEAVVSIAREFVRLPDRKLLQETALTIVRESHSALAETKRRIAASLTDGLLDVAHELDASIVGAHQTSTVVQDFDAWLKAVVIAPGEGRQKVHAAAADLVFNAHHYNHPCKQQLLDTHESLVPPEIQLQLIARIGAMRPAAGGSFGGALAARLMWP